MTALGRLAVPAAVLCAGLLALAAVAEAADEIRDVYGPLDRAASPEAPSRQLPAGLIAAGFGAVGFYWLIRRGRLGRRAGGPPPSAPGPPDERSLALPPGEFYAHLARSVRTALGTTACTPRQMAARPAPAGRPAEGWEAFWQRVEAAEYAAADVPEDRRRADLAFVAAVLTQRHDGLDYGGGCDAV
ncbi:MAG: hypothetical protein GXY85_07010 [Candidatus Brocadiaceae bacterium]|nr:hypothetical protein [Candidatus Brocadiaceae bacterium]